MKEIMLALILVVCAWTDFKYRKIYNVIIGSGIIIALFFSIVSQGWPGLVASLLGFSAGILLLLIPFLMGGIGAGDVKLLSLVGAFNGPVFVFYSFIGTALFGGLMAVFMLLLKHDFLPVLRHLWSSMLGIFFSRFRSVSYELHSTTPLPYGIAIALGTLGAYWVR